MASVAIDGRPWITWIDSKAAIIGSPISCPFIATIAAASGVLIEAGSSPERSATAARAGNASHASGAATCSGVARAVSDDGIESLLVQAVLGPRGEPDRDHLVRVRGPRARRLAFRVLLHQPLVLDRGELD